MTDPAPQEAPPGTSRDLLLLRHAKAARGFGADLERALTRRGHRDAARIARWIRTHELVPDWVIGSPSTRTRETLDEILEELGLSAEAVHLDDRAYLADPPTLLRILAECPATARRVLVVGHNPGLEELVRDLGGATAREPKKGKFFPTCALAHHRVDAPWAGLSTGAAPVVAIVSWSRKKKRWKIRSGEPHG